MAKTIAQTEQKRETRAPEGRQLTIGAHISCSKGYLAAAREAVRMGANTFQFFTRNPRGGSVRALDEKDIAAFRAFSEEHDLKGCIGHAPYTVNACSPKEELREFAVRVLREDLERLALLPRAMMVFHPGSHVRQGEEEGTAQIVAAIDRVLEDAPRVPLLLETMAGKGTEIGGSFEALRRILDKAHCADRLGVCLDTCHVFDAGYDVRGALDDVLSAFDRQIGLSRLRLVHLNDSQNALGSKKDRHAKIGEGQIGEKALEAVVCHSALADLPFILETPNDAEGYAAEIRRMREARTRREKEQLEKV